VKVEFEICTIDKSTNHVKYTLTTFKICTMPLDSSFIVVESSGSSLREHCPLKLLMQLQDARTHWWDDLAENYATNPRFEVQILCPVSTHTQK
jgi:hypothetical protein